MSTDVANNKRIAKNTLFLYFRMAIIMVISLYTSRILLSALGVEDYGIYNAVGGFVAMFHIVNSAMSTATQRFLSFEIGKSNGARITNIFSTSVIIHVVLAFIIFLFAETIGVWFLNTKMVFPEGRIVAANWVFQFSLIAFMINVISVPYNAALIAYEKMSAFAYVSIVEVILKLLIVFCIVLSDMDKLIVYALLMTIVAVFIRFLYGIYVKKHLKPCYNTWHADKHIIKEMSSFVSWNLIGSTAGICQEQGITVLLNLFFGATVNAARGISMQVLHAISGLVSNFNLAMNPQIVKDFAGGKKKEMFELVIRGGKFSYMLMLVLSVPIIIEAPSILNLWLVEVPSFSSDFVRLVLLIALVDSMKYTMVGAVQASGRVKLYQLTNGLFSLLVIPIAYIVLSLGYPPKSALIVSLFISVSCHFIRLAILKKLIDFPVLIYLKTVTLRMILITLISFLIGIYLNSIIQEGLLFFIFRFLLIFVECMGICYLLGLSASERNFIIDQIVKVYKKHK